MNEVRTDIPSPKWQACVSTMKCDYIDEHVSIMVKSDWTSKCTWYAQFKNTADGGKAKVKPDKKTRRKTELCQGPLCSYVKGYRDKLIQEETQGSS